MKAISTKIHQENIKDFISGRPYVFEDPEDGSIDYCLGTDYDQAGFVISVILKIKEERDNAEKENKT